MANLIFILIALVLLVGFFVLTQYEERKGMRFFAQERSRLDRQVARVEFILARVDLAAFLRAEVRRAASRVGHDIVNGTLQAVRAAERLLTRTVRDLRARHTVDMTPRESSRPFVKTLADFKGRLKATRPEVPDVHEITPP